MLVDREKAIAIIEKNALGMSWSESPSESGAGFELLKRAEALRALPVSDGVTDEMVERAARAMCWQDTEIGGDCQKACLANSKCLGDSVAHYRREARTALQAALGPLPAPPTIEEK